jgi:hypothetical protein
MFERICSSFLLRPVSTSITTVMDDVFRLLSYVTLMALGE